jgi:hypothetical protein
MRIPVSALVVLAIAGCTPAKSPVLPAPVPSTTPLFASDEEALAAAEEAYGAYLAVLDEIYADGGAHPERLSEVASADVVDRESQSFSELENSGNIGSGARTFDSVSLQSSDLNAETGWFATVYLCQDYSQTDLLDTNGESIISDGRQTRYPLEVAFELRDRQSQKLVVSSVEDWTGTNFCLPG